MSKERRFNNTYGPRDAELRLEDGAAATTTTGIGQVGGSDKILDLGQDEFRELAVAGEGAYVRGDMLIEVSAVDDTTGDETYELELQLSTDPAFAADVAKRASIKLGFGGGGANADQYGVTRYTLPFDNEIGEKVYRYARLNKILGGTTPSITLQVHLAKAPHVESM